MRLIPLPNAAPCVAAHGDRPVISDSTIQQSRWRVLAWLVIAAMGAAQAWAARYAMHPDGMAYLDLAHAFLRGDWSLAVNRLWSPLYPVLLAVTLRVLRPAPLDEFAAIRVLNFIILLGALASFEFLLSQLIGYHRTLGATASSEGRLTLPEWSLRVLGYASFASSSLGVISIAAVGPDMCVSLFAYLAVGLLLKICQRPEGTPSFLLLGVVLGLGYLAKAPMFPLAFVLLALAAATIYARFSFRDVLRRLLVALIPFALITGSLVLAFSLTGQGVTLGESGRLNYAWHVNGLPYVHWQGEFPGSGKPAHPTRMLSSSPPVYEFATPVGGTYPPWDDPAYWFDGVKVHVDARGHLHNIVRSARVLLGMVVRSQLSLVIGGLLLLYLGQRGRLFLQDTLPYRGLLIPAVAAVGVFSVVWLELRFIAPFVTPFWLGIFASVTFGKSHNVERVIKGSTVAMLAMLILSSSYASYKMGRDFLAQQNADQTFAVARGLQQIGVHPGDKVAEIRSTLGASDAYWALLAQVRIIAEMPACRAFAGSLCAEGQRDGVAAFVRADHGLRAQILEIFESTGAEAVVMRGGDRMPLPGWQRIPETDYTVYLFRSEAPAVGDP